MVVKTLWPGATTLETMQQVTRADREEARGAAEHRLSKSYTKPGESVVFVYLKDFTRAETCPHLWYQVRKKIGDIKQTLPQGVQGPFFNDEFGDTYALIFALTSDGFSHRELRDYAERVRAESAGCCRRCEDRLSRPQDEKIYLEFSTQRLAAMGLDISELIQTLQAQNAIQPSGTVNSDEEKIAVAPLGQLHVRREPESHQFPFQWPVFRLSDIAKVQRGYATRSSRFSVTTAATPSASQFRCGRTPTSWHSVSTSKNRFAKVTADLPAGIDSSDLVADQPEVVEDAVGEFIKTWIEAIVIVLAVSFLALGWRPGIVVAIAIPLRSCHHLRRHEACRREPAAYLARRAYHRASVSWSTTR